MTDTVDDLSSFRLVPHQLGKYNLLLSNSIFRLHKPIFNAYAYWVKNSADDIFYYFYFSFFFFFYFAQTIGFEISCKLSRIIFSGTNKKMSSVLSWAEFAHSNLIQKFQTPD